MLDRHNYFVFGSGQVFTFAATVLPIVAGGLEALPATVQAQAIGMMVAFPATLAAPVMLADLRSQSELRRGVVFSLSSLLIAVAIVAALSQAVTLTSNSSNDALRLSAIHLLGFGTYCISLGYYTHTGNIHHIGWMRLMYGLLSFVSIALVCKFGATAPALVSATAGSYIAAAVFSALIKSVEVAEENRVEVDRYPSITRHYLVQGWTLGIGQSASVGALQVGALVTPALGAIAPFWASVVRVASGFMTVGVSVISPQLNPLWVMARRRRVPGSFVKLIHRGLKAGAILAVCSVATSVGLIVYVASELHYMPSLGEGLALGAGIIGFAGVRVVISPVGQFLSFIEVARKLRVVFDFCSLMACGLAVILCKKHSLYSLGVVYSAITLAYIQLLHLFSKRQERAWVQSK